MRDMGSLLHSPRTKQLFCASSASHWPQPHAIPNKHVEHRRARKTIHPIAYLLRLEIILELADAHCLLHELVVEVVELLHRDGLLRELALPKERGRLGGEADARALGSRALYLGPGCADVGQGTQAAWDRNCAMRARVRDRLGFTLPPTTGHLATLKWAHHYTHLDTATIDKQMHASTHLGARDDRVVAIADPGCLVHHEIQLLR